MKDFSIGSLVNLLAFVAFAAFVSWLYLYKQGEQQVLIEKLAYQNDSLRATFGNMKERLAYYQENEFYRQQAVYDNFFDPFDSENFRVYGLYRDVTGTKTKLDIALMFNISNANSIKISEVMGERWFIVPVKGVHYMMEGENYTDLASYYYEDPADSMLIKRFNLDRGSGENLIIPFGSN